VIQLVVGTVAWLVALFGGAGRFDWTRGWIYVAMYSICMATAGVVVRRLNPTCLEARSRFWRKNTKRFDKIFMLTYLPLVYLQPTVAGLDAVRFHWTSIPFVAVYPGILLFMMSTILITWVMVVNPHAETTVRIQSDRGHVVISSGPYRFVRHPMYVGAIVMYASAALVLGSMWALAISAVMAIEFVVRTALEDRTLRRELPGYDAYAAVTRYRLVPGLW
jgi:protein-S-isoprenylcysteine O-methyltransferase Ste14